MKLETALNAFAALSQETRLLAFRLLVEAGPQGMAAGVISDALGIPHNTLSFHLTHLSQANLVSSRKEGRSIIYMANFEQMRDLIAFMVQDCCSSDLARLHQADNADCAVVEFVDCCIPQSVKTES
ncbi:ArsR/SmtB family transcription factor [Methylophaga sulfidovorans]|uniref:Transcriptional regulator, ArsR family n=1 Tax=Methylophaga sulfidovorans TaxID=45496 RepID=A0A1I3V4A3_9GAMM|nr:metalloregulator ArsR/SmtB family transcription factor [Methylophaga sulfidovorans]SFJ89743.1 transcriptional regulator, ArsR family [Methylophaga sulfidovorans]